jgi:flagellar hook-associated protein 2
MGGTMDNILATLNAGSGLDVKALVSSLVDAERTPRATLLDQRQARVEARLSALGQFRAALDALVTALDQRLDGGTLRGQPRVSDPASLSFTVDPGVTVARQSLEIRQLARPQTLSSAPVADPLAPIGTGTLTIAFGTVAGTGAPTGFTANPLAPLVVPITVGEASLEGMKNAINDAAAVAGAPVQAQLLADAGGTRLVLRGAFGEASGFTVETTGDPALDAFAFNATTAALIRTQAAADAIVAIDGLELRRPANIVTDLVPGARIVLARAAPGAPVAIEAAREPAELKDAVRGVAAALDELSTLGRGLARAGSATASAGALAADGATRRALKSLADLPSRILVPVAGTAPARLSDLGVTLDREGRFIVDEARLARAVADHPGAVEALLAKLNEKPAVGTPAGPLRQLAQSFREVAQGSAGQPTALAREAQAIARDRAQLDARAESRREALTRQFAALDRAVGQSKALRSFLDQQIDLWTRPREP